MIVCTVPWMIPTSTSLIVRVLSVDSLPFSCFVGIVTGSIESPILRAGHMFTCLGFAPLGIIRCWGDSQQGQFGLGTAAIIGDQPSEVPLSLSLQIAFDFFAVGAYHLCVARPGFLGCFGFNINGQLGNGNTNSYGDNPGETNPTNLLGTGEGVAGLALGGSHTCFIVDAPVQMRCTGQNDYGQLGVGSTTQSTTPLQVTLQGISSIAASVISFCAGDQHNCVMDDGGSVYCFGRNAEGQLGIGGVTPIGADPGDILAPVNLGGAAASVHCGGYHTCAVMGGGALRCFGLGNAGQLGNGGTSAIGDNSGEMPPTPTAIPKALRFFSTRSYTSCIVFADGDASCFGRNQFGGLGRGDTNNQVTVPSPINLGLSATTAKIATISPGQSHVCALRTDGDVVCWGQGSSGQLGVGNTLNIGDEPGEMPPALVMLPPFLISVGPSSVSRSSTLLTLSGTAFGNLASNVTVFVGASSCSISSISVVRITCLPAYVVGNYSVTVARNGFGVSNALGPIQFLPSISRTNSRSRTRTRTAPTRPVILGVTPAGGKPGDTISITGYQFGTTSDVTSVTICGTAAPLVSRSVDGSLVLAQIPSSLSPSACFVHVLKNTLIDLGSVSITVVQTFSLASALPTEGQSGTVVNITSLNGPFGGLPTLAQNDVTVVVASSQTATITQFSSNWLLAQMPVGAVGTVTLAVRLFGASWSSNNTVAFTYISTPTISSVYPPVAVPGASLMINGTGFGSNAALLSVSVGGLVCSNMAVLTADTSVSCTLSLSQPLATAASVTLARSSIIASGTQSIQIVSERAALVAFFTSTGGASWTTSTLWQSASSYCSWFGVTCAANGLNVISISLPNNNLVGNSFPSEMPNLFFLAALNLTGNSLSGSLVNTPLCDNDRLVSLDLKNNAFASALPSCFSTLQLLDLSHNAIDTTIPAEYGLSTTLQTLRLAENQLEGFLPTGGFPALRELDVFGNVLYGNLPTFGPLLQTVSIATNRFTGVLSAGSQLCAIPSALLGCNFFSSVCGVSTTLDPNADCVTRGAASAATKNTCERDGLYVDVFASACVSNCGLYAPVPLSNHTTQCQSVLVCTTGCSLCTGEGLEVVGGNCTLCDEPLGYALSLDGSVCTNSCGSNQTVNSQLNPDRCQCDYSNGFFPNAAKTECRRCAFSNQFIDSDDTCKFCHPDCQTCTGPTSGDCLSCPFGVEFRSSGGGCAGSCSSCLSSFVRYAGSMGCVCPPGTSLQAGSCVPCPADTYSPSYGIDNVCIPCGSHRGTGGLANRTAASDCVCKPTFEADQISGACVCPAGRFYDPSLELCSACPANSFQGSRSLLTSCTPCTDLGAHRTTLNAVGANSSLACVCPATMTQDPSGGGCVCAAGYSFDSATTSCRQCPTDSYYPVPGLQSVCNSCGAHRGTGGLVGRTQPSDCACVATFNEVGGQCLCPAGSAYDAATGVCTLCQRDSFTPAPSLSPTCTLCSSLGLYRTTRNEAGSNSSSACVCPLSMIPDALGAGCVCPAGSYFDLQTTSCQVCSPNTYLPSAGLQQVCLNCDTFRVTAGSNQTSSAACVCSPTFVDIAGTCLCPAGSYFDPAGSLCRDCPADTYSLSASLSTSCSSCADFGAFRTTLYQTGANSTEACVCPSSMMADPSGPGCVCPVGYSYATSPSRCTACPVNSFLDEPGLQPSCVRCDQLRTTNGMVGSNSTGCVCITTLQENPDGSGCACPPGSSLDFSLRSCISCLANSYQPAFNSDPACIACAEGRVTGGVRGAINESQCLCPPGSFPDLSGVNCIGCDGLGTGAVCVGASSNTNASLLEQAGIVAKAGYWVTINEKYLTSADEWFGVFKCPVPDGCPGGSQIELCSNGYTGPVCGVCDDGYGRLGDVCALCPAKAASGFLVFLILLLILVGCWVIVHYSLSTEGMDEKSGNQMQRLKIAITHLQIIGFTGNFSTQWPEILVRVFAVPASAATISSATDNIALDCASSPGLFTRAIVVFFIPVILAFGVAVGYGANALYTGSSQQYVTKVWQGTLVLLYVAHPGIFQGVLKSMVCVDVGTEQYAKMDMTVNCANESFMVLRIVSALYIVLYGFGGLIIVAYFVRRDTDRNFLFLTQGYTADRQYWDLVITLRKMLFVVVSVFASAPLQLFFGTWILLFSWVSNHYFVPFTSEYIRKSESASLLILLITVTTGTLFFTDVLDAQAADGRTVATLLILLNFVAVAVFLYFSARKGLKELRNSRRSSRGSQPTALDTL
eukprot:TRINITY_DN2552_c0_g1_i2.p1 TRINITY_DN2552_c0_g1~~TRINITY_DN2552_c0_g1_i2.p1  ORF type:complete len:2316 (+),score=358.28 TRINITY_DN2552_c0_g1_i2:228-6950(+)